MPQPFRVGARDMLGDLLHPRAVAIIRDVNGRQEEGAAVHHEIDEGGRGFLNRLRRRVVLGHALGSREAVAGIAKGGAHVADHIPAFGAHSS